MKPPLPMKILLLRNIRAVFSGRASLLTALFLFPGVFLASSSQAQPPVPDSSGSKDVRQAYESFRHQVKPDGDGWSARNPGQRWSTSFDARGFLATPDSGTWTWGLELTAYGTAGGPDGKDTSRAIGHRAAVSLTENRIHYAWDDTLTEWFINDRRGLEQGWTLRARPGGDGGPLQLTLQTRGPLRPASGSDPRQLAFTDPAGAPVLTYGGLKAWDADGTPLETRFETLPGASGAFRILVDDAAARYPLTIDPLAHQAYLKASNTEAQDFFGYSVALSGDTAVIGAFHEDSAATGVNGNQASNGAGESGAAYVFVRDGGVWTFQAYLKASNTGAGDYFGLSVALDGNTAVIGAVWEDSAATGVNGDQASNAALDAGAAYVFVRSGSTWSQQAYLKASNTQGGDQFGASVALDGNTAVIGARYENSAATGVNGDQTSNAAAGSGAAYVFVRSGSTWSQQAYLKATNTGASDGFGYSVAVSGSLIAVGSPGEDSAARGVGGDQGSNAAGSSGAVYVFSRNPVVGSWSMRYLKASDTSVGDQFGSSVALSGSTLVVGAPSEDSPATGVNGNQGGITPMDSGAAYVFTIGGGVLSQWSQQAYLKASNTGASDYFGRSVGVDGDTAVVGAEGEDSAAMGVNGNQADNTATDSGAVYVFTRVGTSWGQQAYLKPSNTAGFDSFSGVGQVFGQAVAISADTVLAGAFGDTSAATGINGNQSDTSASTAGAAHVFTGFTPPLFRITGMLSVRNPNNSLTVTLSGTGQGTTSHTLQSSPGMAPGTWLGVGTTMSDTEGNFTFGPFTEPASRTRYFYRVGVE